MGNSVKWTVVAAVMLVVALLAVVPVMLDNVNSGDPAQPGGSAAAPEDAGADPVSEVVAERPDCVGTGVAGVELPCLGGTAGQVAADAEPAGTTATVVNLWAWWCGPCRDELPVFDEFAAAHPEYNVVGVHADPNPANGAAMLNDLGISLPSHQDDENLFAGTLGLPGVVPITVVLVDGEQVAMFPRPFESLAELETAVEGALT